MSTPTRQDIINAHEALSSLNHLADNYISFVLGGGDETKELRQAILRALPPKPQPTMAEVEWDEDKHYLAEAEHPGFGKVIMLHPASDTEIECLCNWRGLYRAYSLITAYLTPTGKRYTLTEVQDG